MKVSHSFMPVAVGLILALQPGAIAQAQEYPVRPITLIVPWPAGGAQDALGRMLAPRLADRLGRAITVENRPGAGSVIGMGAAARSAPDGYTLAQAGAAFAINATVHKKLPYESTTDFAPWHSSPKSRLCSWFIRPWRHARLRNWSPWPRQHRAICRMHRADRALRTISMPNCSRA
jgi:tripartite-type tricarboxylate transporter receptor subunit TctC